MKNIMSKARYRFLMLLCGAFIMGLTLIFPGKFGFVQWFAFIPAVIALDAIIKDEKMTARKAYGYGFFFFMAMYVVVYHWFWSMYPLDFTGLSPFYALCVILLASFGLPLLASVAGGFTFVFPLWCKRSKTLSKYPILPFVIFAFAYTVFDWTQTQTFMGVPWGRLSIGQSENSIILCSVSFFGSYFLTFSIVLVNTLLAYAILYRKRRACAGALASFAFVLLLGICGNLLTYTCVGDKVTAAAIQGNMPSSEKWSVDGISIAADKYTVLTEKAIAEGAELVVWPESVFPTSVNNSDAVDCVTSLTEKHDIELFYGCIVYSEDRSTNYNAIVNASGGRIDYDNMYFKRHLVPFGEYVPLRPFVEVVFPMLGQVSMLSTDTTPGTDSNLFSTEYGKVGALVCFDTIYDIAPLDAVRDGAELIVIGTNDSWFFDSAAGYMHNAQAKIRACETGRYIVRSANTGISSIINARGETLDIEYPLVEGYVVADVEFRYGTTLYTLIGNAFVWLSAFVILSIPALLIKERFSESARKDRR